MRFFNRALAAIVSLVLIAAAAIGIIYLVGLIAGSTAITNPIEDIYRSVVNLPLGTLQAILLGSVIASLVLFILELRPSRPRFITVSYGDIGKTQVFKADIESFLANRLAREQKAITPRRMNVRVLDDYRFDVDTSVEASTTADTETVRHQVDDTIRRDLADIGLDDELDRVNSQVERVKRAA